MIELLLPYAHDRDIAKILISRGVKIPLPPPPAPSPKPPETVWPVDDKAFYRALCNYQDNPTRLNSDILIEFFLYPICQRQYDWQEHEALDYDDAVQVAVNACLDRSKATSQRRLSQKGKRRGLPIAGFDPAVHTKPFNLYCKFAYNAIASECRKERRRDRIPMRIIANAEAVYTTQPKEM